MIPQVKRILVRSIVGFVILLVFFARKVHTLRFFDWPDRRIIVEARVANGDIVLWIRRRFHYTTFCK